jgi:hypothetical protein
MPHPSTRQCVTAVLPSSMKCTCRLQFTAWSVCRSSSTEQQQDVGPPVADDVGKLVATVPVNVRL